VRKRHIAAIVLNWNRARYTLACVASLRATYGAHRLSVIVVDNGSKDSSWEELKQLTPADVTLIQTGANLGYAGGNNVGIHAALDLEVDYIWILNNDTLIHHHCLDELLRAAEKYPQAGVLVPKILYKDLPGTLWYAGGSYNPVLARTVHRGIGAQDESRFDATCDVTFATGCSLFVRREIFELSGLFDDRYFLYWEDVEFSSRVLHAGYKICFVPTARIWHEEGTSSDHNERLSPTYHYYTTRNRLWYIREKNLGWTKVSAYMFTIPLLLRRLAPLITRREHFWVEKSAAIVSGLRDGVFGRPPSGSKLGSQSAQLSQIGRV
jgi:GT2 family glycosyltransferase